MDSAILSALVAALVTLALAWANEQRARRREKRAEKKDEVGDAVQLRIREIDAVEEFRDALRDTVREQGERIERLEKELERARLARLAHERERLEWNEERVQLGGRILALETFLHINGFDASVIHLKAEDDQ